MSEEADDLEGDLRAAFAADQPQSAEPVAAAPEPVVAEDDGRPRDEHGRFVPKVDKQAEPAQSQLSSGQEASQPILPPASWTPTAKAKWNALDPDVQREILRREGDITKGLTEFEPKAQRLNKLDEVLNPVRDRLRMTGLADEEYIKTLVAADSILRGPNAIQGFAYLAQQYGVHPQALINHFMGQPQQAFQPQPPQQDPILTRLEQIDQRLSAREQAEQQQVQAETQAQIQSFASDPAHLYFENVKADMAVFLRSGKAKTLEDAYDMACHADPVIRNLIAKPGAVPSPGKPNGKTVTGSPGQTAKANGRADSNSSIEDDVRQAMEQLAGRV